MTSAAFIEKAKDVVYIYTKTRVPLSDVPATFGRDDVFVTWFCKTLQHWKALLGTTIPDQRYYEVTYNGDKNETYVDAYVKRDQMVV
jgi:hypothetical protein